MVKFSVLMGKGAKVRGSWGEWEQHPSPLAPMLLILMFLNQSINHCTNNALIRFREEMAIFRITGYKDRQVPFQRLGRFLECVTLAYRMAF